MITDFHTHLLPCIDDGSGSLAESIAMLQTEAEQNISRIAATPHFYPQQHKVDHFLRNREDAYALLNEEMSRHGHLPEIVLGAEVYYFSGISQSEIVPRMAITGTNCMLLEMPFTTWTNRMYQEMEDIYVNHRITPIIAHVDRYIRPFATHGIPDRLAELPVLVQANASFFLHSLTRPMALRMIQQEQIHLLGSDCHNMTSRKPNLGEAIQIIQKRFGTDVLENIHALESDLFTSR